MGIDLLDLQFRIERTFKIKLDRTESGSILAVSRMNGTRKDIRVRDLVSWIESRVNDQYPSYDGNVFEAVRRDIADCLAVEESAVTLDAWLVGDLGMD